MNSSSNQRVNEPSLRESYDAYPLIEEQFIGALNRSLKPRGPNLLYEIVEGLGLPAGATAVDVGCGEGQHSLALAERFGFKVNGIDPVERHIELCNERLPAQPELRDRLRFMIGTAERLPLVDQSVDFIWCRDVFSHVADLDLAFRECRRVLRPRGRMLLYQMFATDRLESREKDRVFIPLKVVSFDPAATEAAIERSDFRIDQRIVLGGEWGEYFEEHGGSGARSLLHAARMLRDPARYVAKFGQLNYDIKLADCLWHVYRMIGKLSGRIYVLSGSA